MTTQRFITALAKHNGERYIFVWDAATKTKAHQTVNCFAIDPRLSLTWSNAVELHTAFFKQSGQFAINQIRDSR